MTGGERRSFHLLQALTDSFQVVGIAPTYPGTRNETVTLHKGYIEHRLTKTRAYQEWNWQFEKQKLGARGSDLSLALTVGTHKEFLDRFRAEIVDARAVLYQHPSLAVLLELVDHSHIDVYYLSHNCEFELTCQNTRGPEAMAYRQLMFQLEHRLCKRARRVFAVSEEDRAKFISLYGVDPARAEVVPNGALFPAPEAFHADSAGGVKPVAVFVGSDWPANNAASNFIVTTLAPACPNVHFAIVGSTAKSLTARGSMPDNVETMEGLSDQDLRALYLRARVALNPMTSGGGSNVKIAEYLSYGLTVLTTPTGMRGYPTDLPRVHVCEEADFATMLPHIIREVPNPEERARASAAARSRWDWQAIGERLSQSILAPLPTQSLKKRVLAMNEFAVRGAPNGGQARIAGLYREPDPDCWVTILTFGRDGFRANRLGPRTVCIEIPTTPGQDASVKEANAGAYATVSDLVYPMEVASNALWLQVFEANALDANILIFEHPFMLPCYEQTLTRLPFVYSSHNVEADLKAIALATHKAGPSLIAETIRQEHCLVRRARAVAACSPNDEATYRTWGGATTGVFANGVAIPRAETELAAVPPRAASLASGNHDFRFVIWDHFNRPDLAESEFEVAFVRAVLPAGTAPIGRKPSESRAEWALRIIRSEVNIRGLRTHVWGLAEAAGATERIAVFLGSGHRPNLTAAELIVRVVAPRCPEVTFILVGEVCHSVRIGTEVTNVFCAGRVSDAEKSFILRRSTIGLNPMVDGGGSNLKIPDYLVHALPVLSTRFGSRGFSVDEAHGLFAVDVFDYPARLSELVADTGELSQLGKRAEIAARFNYDWTKISRDYFAFVGQVLAASRHEENSLHLIVVIEDEQLLREQAQFALLYHLEGLVRSGGVRLDLIIQRDLMTTRRGGALRAALEAIVDLNVHVVHKNLELQLENASKLTFDGPQGQWLRVFRRSEQAQVPPPISAAEPVLCGGWSDVVAGKRPYRFIWREAEILVNGGGLLEVSGYTPKPARLRLRSGTEVIDCGIVEKRFKISNIVAGSFARITAEAAETQSGRFEAFVSVDTVTIQRQGLTLVCDMLRDMRDYVRVSGDKAFAVEQHLLWGGSSLAPSAGVTTGAVHAVKDLACPESAVVFMGDLTAGAHFASSLASHGLPVRVFGFDGLRLTSLQRGKASTSFSLPLHAEDWELGFSQNIRERRHYAGALAGARPILVTCDRIDGQALAFASRLKERLKQRYGQRPVFLLPAYSPPSSEARGRAEQAMAEAGVEALWETQSRRLIALCGEAALVVLLNRVVIPARLLAYLRITCAPTVFLASSLLGCQDVMAGCQPIASPEEAVAAMWYAESSGQQKESLANLEGIATHDTIVALWRGRLSEGSTLPGELESAVDAGALVGAIT
jgi:glycosyltransferase involved in cell wall biosynthesis